MIHSSIEEEKTCNKCYTVTETFLYTKMSLQSNIFSNKFYLKQINKNFDYLIKLIQSNSKPLLLSSKQPLETKEISFEFLQEFNNSNQNQQIQLLSNLNELHQLWIFLSLNPTSYDCQNFIEELYQLTSTTLSVKQHLGKLFYCYILSF